MTQTTARTKKDGKHYEILVDLEEAMKVKRDDPTANINQAVLTEYIFHNLKEGSHASDSDLEKNFGTNNAIEVATKIIKSGEVVQTTESMKADQDQKYKQVVDFLVRNASSPEGRPYTPDRIMKALQEAHVNVKNKPIESQVSEIIDQLSKVLPVSIQTKKVKLLIPAVHTGKAYGAVKEFMKQESWQSNGNLEVIVEVPSGLLMDFYDKINSATSGSVLSEELKN